MSLRKLFEQNSLQHHTTSRKEIGNLMQLVRRDLNDAKLKGLSSDRRFATAYNAVLQSATILLYCKGYKPKGPGHHFTVFKAMREIMGRDHAGLSDYFDSCRSKRNLTDYSYPGGISESEADELVVEAEKFFTAVRQWLNNNYPKLVSEEI
ncbi:MAG: SAV_6107 family HEPN domain-containing protein [Candidatus Omnitrophica bacterium]|nr:SAV_6107 family HEPN domain-containing protein [Candidatus Omnitrophota bacterium]